VSKSREDLDRYFEYGIYPQKRILDLLSVSEDEESGTDHKMFERFLKGITYLDSLSNKSITVQMNNIGGDWYHGMAIYNLIRACRCHVTIIAYAHACSMGSVILQAADTRIIAPDCVTMIHDGMDSLDGSQKSVENWAKEGKHIRKRMYDIYFERMKAAKPRITLKKIEELCSHDTIFNAQQAVDVGLADWVLESLEDPKKWVATKNAETKWQPEIKIKGKHEKEEDDDV